MIQNPLENSADASVNLDEFDSDLRSLARDNIDKAQKIQNARKTYSGEKWWELKDSREVALGALNEMTKVNPYPLITMDRFFETLEQSLGRPVYSHEFAQKGSINIAVIVGVIILVGVAGYFVVNRQTSSSEPIPSPTPNSFSSQTPTPSSSQAPSLSNNCEGLVSYNAKEYQDGWEKTFKKENNLSDLEFNTYTDVTSVSLRPIGLTCELEIRYAVKKDWFLVNQIDHMTLGVPPTISPSNLPLESDPTEPGRIGVSTVNLHDLLSFRSQTEALNFFVDKYNLKGTGAKILQQGFHYFWNKESAEESGYPFAGEGGEAFISVFGTINSSQNKCYSGELSLVSKETTYYDTPCQIY